MIHKLANIHPILPKMTLFLFVSSTTVFVELFAFWFTESVLEWHYSIAISSSLLIALVVNWYASKIIVFKNAGSKALHHELLLILFAGFITWLIQLAITALFVEQLELPALLGKVVSLGICFFWNFWFRHRFVFND